MNGQHLRAFFWLHWRLRVNQFKRGGTLNAVLFILLAVGATLLGVFLFFGFFLIGLYGLHDAPPSILMYVWDGLVVAFLLSWMIGLIAELQRSEALSLDRFLHLPVSLSGVFVLNYLASMLSLTLALMFPAMLGLSLGLVFGRGLAMLLVVPLLCAFLLMVSAVSYQFQGWLASLMVNKRRRRTIVVLVTVVFVVIFQLPNLANIFWPWQKAPSRMTELIKESADLNQSFHAERITVEEYKRGMEEVNRKIRAEAEQQKGPWEHLERAVWLANLALPPGWLPWGAMAAAEGNGLYAVLATLGMALVGTASLRRAYRTTLRLYTGQFTSQPGAQAPVIAPAADGPRRAGLLERDLPWLSEHAAAIALTSFRSLMRAPEVKLLLLSPVLLMLIFGGMFLRGSMDPPKSLRPFMAIGAQAMVLLSIVQLVGNQFGFDRSGFRVFVLCPARRGDILLGKNLSVAPMALGLALLAWVLVEVAYRMRLDHFLAGPPQLVSMYLLFCLLANCLSILAPMATSPGTLKPTGAKLLPVLLHLVFVFAFPIVVLPVMLPLAIEALLEALGVIHGVPLALLLSVLECGLVIFLYRWLVGWQGVWLQSRERHILEVVTAKAE